MTAPVVEHTSTADVSSQELVARFQAGDRADAFDAIYRRYYLTVYRFVLFRTGYRQLAEDLTGDTFVRAFRRLDRFSWVGTDLGAWLVTIARNLVADHYKSGRYRLEVLSDDATKAAIVDIDARDLSAESHPEAAVTSHLTNLTLLAALRDITWDQREVLVLRFLKGLSVSETAEAMGRNEGAIKALQYRAVRSLARELGDLEALR